VARSEVSTCCGDGDRKAHYHVHECACHHNKEGGVAQPRYHQKLDEKHQKHYQRQHMVDDRGGAGASGFEGFNVEKH